jgi:hypothetical protein
MNRLVFIHGRSQQGRVQADILKEWRDAWDSGLVAGGLSLTDVVDVALPFYGDTLDQMATKGRAPTAGVATRGNVSDEELAFKFQILDEIATTEGITPADIDRHYSGSSKERGPLNWEWVQAILQSIDQHTGLGDDALDRFTHDVFVYLKWPAVRAAIDALVAAAFKPGTSVVVGHSLGTVVGYNVLRSQAAELDVVRYVTVGSPLGIRAIQSGLDLPLEMPRCVRDWYNAMDDRDVVALRPLDAKSFPIQPAIRNKTSVNNKTTNRHGIVGYLDDRDVAKEIFTAL